MTDLDLVREFARYCHDGQIRKYTGEPYINHPVSVAAYVHELGGDKTMQMAALLHDTLEDTWLTPEQLRSFLFGANIAAAELVYTYVIGLTDRFTKTLRPDLNRKKRKALEADRLAACGPEVQLIKLCDIIDNARSFIRHDPDFAKVYLAEADILIRCMNKVAPDIKTFTHKVIQEMVTGGTEL